jgi:hypothetical protein
MPFFLVLRYLRTTFSVAKKAFLVIFVYLSIIAIFASVISKNPIRVDRSRELTLKTRAELYKTLNDPTINARLSGRVFLAVYRNMTCFMTGEACTKNPDDGDKNASKSFIGHMSSLIAVPYTYPPASGVYWAYDGLQQSGFIPKTYAAEGVGFSAIKPLINMWKVFRDISYMLLVLVLVSIGFMVMFRTKINPQTVISAENSLPKIIVALLLITFSFAIAGFLVDLMYVLIVLVVSILGKSNANYDIVVMQNKYLNANMGTIYDSLFPDNTRVGMAGKIGLGNLTLVGNAIVSLLPAAFNNVFRIVAAIVPLISLNTLINNIAEWSKAKDAFDNLTILGFTVGELPSALIGSILTTIIVFVVSGYAMLYGLGIFVGLMVWFTIVFLMFRVFFMLFRAYLQILFMIIVAPIILLFEAVPGKSTFSYWLKNLFAELITFPVVIAIFMIGNILVTTLSYPGDFWIPPFLHAIDPNGFAVIIGMGFMMLIPDLVKMVKEALGAKGLPINIGVGTFFGAASAGLGGGMSVLSQISTLSMASTALTGKSLNQLFKPTIEAKKTPPPATPPPPGAGGKGG